MSFLAPGWLILLALVAGLAAAYAVAQRRRLRYAVRFTNLDLLDAIAPHRPGWRRHLPALALLGSLLCMVIGLARPVRSEWIPRQEGILVLGVDVSPSMMATDVAPSRFAAMQAAVSRFTRMVPRDIGLGLVSFAGTAQVTVPPTTDHKLVRRALGQLHFRSETALGDAILASLDAIGMIAKRAGGPPAAGVVIMSDGASTTGRPEQEAIQRARAGGVPVSTVVFGTSRGSVVLDGNTLPVPANGRSLERIAAATGGRFFRAASARELVEVYRTIGRSVENVQVRREITRWFVGAAFALALLGGMLSLVWFSRIP